MTRWGGRRRYSRKGGAGAGLGCLVLLAGVVLLWLVVVVVGAIIAVFSTPYPWIALGLGALGYGAFHGTRTFRRQRLHKLFFDAVASIHAAEPRARELLSELQQAGGEAGSAHRAPSRHLRVVLRVPNRAVRDAGAGVARAA